MTFWNESDADRVVSLASGAMSRRELFRRVAAAGLFAPAAAGLLVACGSDDEGSAQTSDSGDEDAPVETEEEESSEDPKRGGVLRIGVYAPPGNFDPQNNLGFESTWPNSQMYSRLLRMTHDMEVVPDLALSWEPSEDGVVWTFQLREGVTFHDGKPFVAQDAVGSFERMLDPEEGVPIRSQYEVIERLEAPSDTELVIHLRSVYADLPGALTSDRALIFDRNMIDTLSTDPIGTGPYRMKSHQPGERTVLERFEDYYDLENQAFVDEVHYISMVEETSRVEALIGGTIHIIPEITPPVLQRFENADGIVVDEIVTGRYSPIVMDASQEPFNDNRVRYALKLCAQREEMLQAVLQGAW